MSHKFLFCYTGFFLGLLFNSLVFSQSLQISTPNNNYIKELSNLDITYKFLDENTIELNDTIFGWKRIKTLKEPTTKGIYNWADERDIPVLEIDPTLIDTSKWTGWYDYWTYVPISNGSVPFPLLAYDFDGNKFPEVYGIFGGIGFGDTRSFEIYPDGSSLQGYYYFALPVAASTQILDIDNNSLFDVAFVSGERTYVYEQQTISSLPTQPKFTFNKYDGLGAYLSREKMAFMDNDTLMDFVHRGADTSISSVYLFYVSEYNPSSRNFKKEWNLELTDDFYDGFDIGDYDGDELMEFITSSITGKLIIVENTEDNIYEIILQDSLPFVNMYYQTSGDIDGDGKREFFIGATMGNGNWTLMYEVDNDNMYSPRFIFNLLSGGSLDEPTYITEDIDGDGKPELAILSGGFLYVFKSAIDDSYYLWYLKNGPSSFQINFYDMNGDSTKDILWSSIINDSWATNIYKGLPPVGVKPDDPNIPEKIVLMQNYPNPFNPITNIKYAISSRQYAILKIYDVLGREMATLVDEEKEEGNYAIEWNASEFPSGVYFYKLETEWGSISRKMMLIK